MAMATAYGYAYVSVLPHTSLRQFPYLHIAAHFYMYLRTRYQCGRMSVRMRRHVQMRVRLAFIKIRSFASIHPDWSTRAAFVFRCENLSALRNNAHIDGLAS